VKKRIRLLLGIVFITALLAGAGMIVRQQMDYQKGRKDYEEAVAIMRQTAAPKEQEEAKAEVDLEEAPLPSESLVPPECELAGHAPMDRGKKEESFRSVLELLFLMDSALRDSAKE